ncbi:MAG: carbon-monoxide dehydrogenase small subunit [Saprospiraceae bacterium]|jgi:carbon-monoxide dehydrogenase small subunit
MEIEIKINGTSVKKDLTPMTTLAQFLREGISLTGTHIGCDTSSCGACTVTLNGDAVKSCTILAVQADGTEVTTIEGMANGNELHPIQAAFKEHHGLQCGFCTPGMVMTAVDILKNNPNPTEDEIRHGLEGNFCRCTGYHNIVKSIQHAAQTINS